MTAVAKDSDGHKVILKLVDAYNSASNLAIQVYIGTYEPQAELNPSISPIASPSTSCACLNRRVRTSVDGRRYEERNSGEHTLQRKLT